MAVKPWRTNERGYRIGEDHPRAVLTDHEIELIRDLHELYNIPVRVIADKFGIHVRTAYKIVGYQIRAQTMKEMEK